ncbi:bacillithiol system protein YtxJ [Ornithinibacillus halophilus]|uniref:Bacillithiol system protein YtxJ n=1 Tax=Ornithinibacillus halophilus TaxID=930117 RepID=A0A1M5HCQ2_9BACI|nr:bacillithiol system protein YtxJ [Ornithinibacillus halophilus]
MENMKELTNDMDWYDVWERSFETPVLLFKHSTSCMISARALKQVLAFQKKENHPIDCYMVKVIESRKLSNKVASDTTIPHKSPQLLLIDKQSIVWNTSHWKITENNIREAIQQFTD